jgi:flagellar basal body-associated protein FliL
MNVAMPTIIPTKPKGRSRKRLFIICGIVGLLLAAGVGFAFTPVGSQFYGTVAEKVGELFGKTKPVPADNAQDEPATPTNTNETYTKASESITAGKPQDATTQYQEKIDATENKSDKAKLYMELSGAFLVYGTDDDKETALKYALEAEKLAPTMQSAAQLAEVYGAMENTAQAKKYEQLTVDRDTSEWKDR